MTTTNSSSNKSHQVVDRKFLWSEDLADFLGALDVYNPTLPVEFTQYHLKTAGVQVEDPRIAKLISLASDHFLAGVINDAKQFAALRSQSIKSKRKSSEITETLELEEIEKSLAQKRVSVRHHRSKESLKSSSKS